MSRSEVIKGIFNRTKKIDSFSGPAGENSIGAKINFLDPKANRTDIY